MREDLPQPSQQLDLEPPASGIGSTYPSVAALAADIGLSERSTRDALRRGVIPHIRVGRRFILPRAAIGGVAANRRPERLDPESGGAR